MILNIYKPKNWTSFDVVAKVRNKFRTRKVGHAGTLDPLAEGVLLVLTDTDTKKQSQFMFLEKEYKAKIALGVTSPTYDLEGPLESVVPLEVISTIYQEVIEKELVKFVGNISQTVPPYSAVKVSGTPLYRLTRKNSDNVTACLPVKRVFIKNIVTTGFKLYALNDLLSDTAFATSHARRQISTTNSKLPDSQLQNISWQNLQVPVVSCTITCSKGTYIRSLAHDLGQNLKTGGVLVELVRSKVGNYSVEDSVKLDDLL